MGLDRRVDALDEVVMTVAAALALKDGDAARFMGDRFRRMLARATREEEAFTVAYAALLTVEDAAGVS